MTPPPDALTSDRLAGVYQLKIHLLGISPQISRRVLVRGDTTLAELHHVFQVVMGWENWHLHSFHLWGKDYGMSYAGGTWYADDARRVHLGDFPWQVHDKFTYTYDFGDYWCQLPLKESQCKLESDDLGISRNAPYNATHTMFAGLRLTRMIIHPTNDFTYCKRAWLLQNSWNGRSPPVSAGGNCLDKPLKPRFLACTQLVARYGVDFRGFATATSINSMSIASWPSGC